MNIWKMKLGESLSWATELQVCGQGYVGNHISILRVPGGWLFGQEGRLSVFVPYSEDLKPSEEPTAETVVDLGQID